ncbi:type II secretion system F family protein [Lactobacillus kullabergensis]|uniref:type II secretion system F family protein n=1 Tax=Lactobacillus TaxID=1578 RepID=UPI0018DD35E7|nr:type II secretion system F family protein [Lactobacillus kullabergensis]MBI0120509.1 type II secretion system F family protein [Lactobacillus sp. M0398]MBI0122657.1 type II secretion system F family protein [Lactobacillus sp. W8174]MBI0134279.1 type II secretion system F family protein [Lactobacillus sp. W8173]MCX0290731.1 type II secretion system F family protein [Lactobacillus kullabergensis]
MNKSLKNFRQDKLSNKERLEFLEYLQNSLSNGFSLNTSLEMMPIIWPKKKILFNRLSKRIRSGKKLSSEMLNLGFSKTIATQIELSMVQGNLIECLTQIATLTRLKQEQIKKLKSEMTYPFILVLMMIFLLLFMQTFVSNQFAESGEHTGDYLLLLLLILSLSLVYFMSRMIFLLRKQDYRSLKRLSSFPIVGPLIQIYVKYILIYDTGLLLSSGFSLQKICDYSAMQVKGSLQQYVGKKVGKQLAKGMNPEEIIKKEQFLPNEILLLLKAGSTRDDLSKKFLLLGRSFFNDLTQKIEKLIVNVQPICFILIGLCIIGLYLKLLLPMYAMMQEI